MDKEIVVLQTLDDLNNYVPRYSVRIEKVSKWSVGMQIEHCLLGTTGICMTLVNSKPHTGRIRRGLIRRMIFMAGVIPRGRGQAPSRSLPNAEITESRLNELLLEAKLSVQKAAAANDNSWWEHHSFGVMKRDDALRFVAIHNRHHLKIVSDILNRHE